MLRTFETFSYATRPNKAVERKLIVECLATLRRTIPIDAYQYVGFGSMWFTDFILMHRVLHIRKMVSIEREISRGDRALFNRPFSCVDVVLGAAKEVLPKLAWSQPAIVWLDYEEGVRGDVWDDTAWLAAHVAEGSIVIATINGHVGSLGDSSTILETKDRENALRSTLGALVPATIPENGLTPKGYPKLVASMLTEHLGHVTRKTGRDERFHRLFAFEYSDGAPMVTVGGIVGSEHTIDKLLQLRLEEILPYTKSPIFEIAVPPLTPKEKVTLDQLLPQVGIADLAKLIGFHLNPKQLASYVSLYRFYPEYREVVS